MSFAHPSALWLLALLPILWLVHRRRPRQRVMIANLFLWRSEGRPEPALLSRWRRRNPLLWVQMAVLAALALVLAGPSWTARRNTIAVVIDVSLSMGARDGTATRLDLARTRVRALLGAEARGATLHLWTAGGTAAEVGSFSATDRALQQALDDLEPTDGRADIAGAVRRARQSDAAPRRIYVVSDSVVSDSVVSGSVASDSPTPLGAPDVEWLPVGRPAENLAITSMAVTRVPGQLDETRVFVDVRNFGTASRGVRVAISRDGRVLSRQAVEVPALRTVGLVARRSHRDA
jgi:hypothetical protein